jgi:hypothetical protein
MNFIAGLFAALAISAVSVIASVDQQAQARPDEITTIGCVRAWKPAPADVTKLPEIKQPGVFLLTPMASDPLSADLPTYRLTPTLVFNFAAHLDDKVEIVGVPQSAPLRRTIGAIGGAPTARPEEHPDLQSMPRLTVRSFRKLSDACPS